MSKPVTFEQAEQIAQSYIANDDRIMIIRDFIEEYEFGWVFRFNTKDFNRTRDAMDGLLGGPFPVIVYRDDEFGSQKTAFGSDSYIETARLEWKQKHPNAKRWMKVMFPDPTKKTIPFPPVFRGRGGDAPMPGS